MNKMHVEYSSAHTEMDLNKKDVLEMALKKGKFVIHIFQMIVSIMLCRNYSIKKIAKESTTFSLILLMLTFRILIYMH